MQFGADDEVQVARWLHSNGLEQYQGNFLSHGYDLETISHMSPFDFSAIQITNPEHRNRLSSQAGQLRASFSHNHKGDQIPSSVDKWLTDVGLPEYIHTFRHFDVRTVEELVHITMEDMQVGCFLQSARNEPMRFLKLFSALSEKQQDVLVPCIDVLLLCAACVLPCRST